MTFFIFAGDMLVMLFMVCLVVWVYMVAPDRDIEATAAIPLMDEEFDDAPDTAGRQEGDQHG